MERYVVIFNGNIICTGSYSKCETFIEREYPELAVNMQLLKESEYYKDNTPLDDIRLYPTSSF